MDSAYDRSSGVYKTAMIIDYLLIDYLPIDY
jgi:hypothetical protein